MFSSKKRNAAAAAAAAAQARQEAALRGAGLGISSAVANRKEHEHERTTSNSTTASRGLASPPLASPRFGIPPPPPALAAAKQWDVQVHERTESNSTSTTATAERSLASPLASPKLGLTFDFELPPSPALSSGDIFNADTFFKLGTSDGISKQFGEESGRKSSVTAPTLPPMSSVTGRKEDVTSEQEREAPPAFGVPQQRIDQLVEPKTLRQAPPKAPPPPTTIAPAARKAGRTTPPPIPIASRIEEKERPISPPPLSLPQPPKPRKEEEAQTSLSPQSLLPPRHSSRTPPQEKDVDFFPSQPPPQSRAPPQQPPKERLVSIPPPPLFAPPQIPVSKAGEREDSDNISTHSKTTKRSRIKSFFFDKPNPNFASQSRPSSAGGSPKMPGLPQDLRPSTSSGSSSLKMEPSLFPSREAAASPIPEKESLPMMNRAWLDARDRPYQNATPKPGQIRGPYLQQTHSTPDLLSTSTGLNSTRSPLGITTTRSPLSTSASADTSPDSPRLTFVRQVNSFGKSSLSAESEVSSPVPTIGTPYQETSPEFPPPQYVATRPRTAGAGASTVGGVSVPTHYSSSNTPTRPETSSGSKPDKEDKSEKREKRKTRLLNPMNLLSRRKSSQEEVATKNEKAVQAAQAQALQKQKSVAITGVNRIPENYDPSIRGRVVHDFSAPRGSRRTGSYSDGPEPAWNAVARGLQSAYSAPFIPTLQDDGRQSSASGSGSGSGKHLSGSTMATSSSGALDRRSRYTSGMGAFHEHLSETPDRGSRISSLQAERRENKDFLQRNSHLSQQSQESAILPPFARRSQVPDPTQAGFYQDLDDSNRGGIPTINTAWKDNRDSTVSAMSIVSPITARTSSAVGLSDAHISFSPVSPTSPSAGKLGSDGRPGGAISPSISESRPPSSYFSVRAGSKSSRKAVSPLDDRENSSPARSPGEAATEDATQKKEKTKGFSSKILSLPFRSAPDVPPRDPSAASGHAVSPINSPTSRSIKSIKSTKSGRSGRSLGGTPSLHSLPSNQPTPEPQVAEPAIVVNAPKSPRLVAKLASAVGHGKRHGSKKDKLEHHVSNASRFSFQFGGSSAEEQALEEKARKMRTNGQSTVSPVNDVDDEDFFDEDAMDDMDEMEIQAEGQPALGQDGIVVNQVGGKPLSLLEQVQLLQAQQAEQAQQAAQADAIISGANGVPARASVSDFMYRSAMPTSKSKLQLQLDIHENDPSKSESEQDDDDESGYWATDDFMGYSAAHTRESSVVETGANTDPTASSPLGTTGSPSRGVARASNSSSPSQPRRRTRGASAASARGLTLNTNVGPSSSIAPVLAQPPDAVRAAAAAFVQNTLSDQARSGFYMQPSAAGYSPTTANVQMQQGNYQAERPVIPNRYSGNSERNRLASGLSFASIDDGSAGHKAALSDSTIGSTVGGSSSSEPRTTSTGLGLSGFSDFKFTDSAPSSRPLSLEKVEQNRKRRTGDSDTIPREVNFTASSNSLARLQHGRCSSGWTSEGNVVSSNGSPAKVMKTGQSPHKQPFPGDDIDDMYFDDGGFEQDVEEGQNVRGGVDESAFDDEGFDFERINGVGHAVQPPNPDIVPSGHSRDVSALTVTSLGSDGPYPSFAMPNPAKARQRDSSYLLEDLPLQEPAVDPKLVPRRNPSEDAKRLGLSDRVPPLPAQPGSLEAVQRTTANLQAYHAALAEAANKAASDGRFLRMPSVSTVKSESLRSAGEANGETQSISRDASHYSRNDGGETPPQANGVADLDWNSSAETSHSKMDRNTGYSPPKLPAFDFGFDSITHDDMSVGDFDDLDDDDIVAAANAEVLASDDEGFYGQEFGFYAKARPNSGDLQAVNGGYFGQDGDDGLTRNKSIHEPNLTPITERSEFSTRNSFIGMGGFAPTSAGPMSAGSFNSMSPALARLPFSALDGGEVTSFDQLRKLRAHAFGSRNGSFHSDGHGSNVSLPFASDSPTGSARSSAAAQGYFGPMGGAPMAYGYSTDSSGSSNPPSALPPQQLGVNPVFQDSPHSAASNGHLPFSMAVENDAATPRRAPRDPAEAPLTARKVPVPVPSNPYVGKAMGHSRQSSKDSVTYVQEQDPAGTGQPRWVIERRRTSEQGQLELVGREVVRDGWI